MSVSTQVTLIFEVAEVTPTELLATINDLVTGMAGDEKFKDLNLQSIEVAELADQE